MIPLQNNCIEREEEKRVLLRFLFVKRLLIIYHLKRAKLDNLFYLNHFKTCIEIEEEGVIKFLFFMVPTYHLRKLV